VLTVAVPSIGRPSLARCVFSFIDQLEPGDEVIFVGDRRGDLDYVKFVHRLASGRNGIDWRFAVAAGECGWGQPQRNRAYELATPGSHVWCIADDDVATSGALAAIRGAVDRAEAPWFIFRAGRGTDAPWLWQDETVRVGNLDGDCLVVPAGVQSRWGLRYEGDADLAHSLVRELGRPSFETPVVAVAKPNVEYLPVHYERLVASV
jgi:hypothetical protein